jgi:O-methyltransferase involved in polyketide biosynthesis
LWEGVTFYLGEAEARHTMKQLVENSAPGSVLLAEQHFMGQDSPKGPFVVVVEKLRP